MSDSKKPTGKVERTKYKVIRSSIYLPGNPIAKKYKVGEIVSLTPRYAKIFNKAKCLAPVIDDENG